jgi:hypothetical protein
VPRQARDGWTNAAGIPVFDLPNHASTGRLSFAAPQILNMGLIWVMRHGEILKRWIFEGGMVDKQHILGSKIEIWLLDRKHERFRGQALGSKL